MRRDHLHEKEKRRRRRERRRAKRLAKEKKPKKPLFHGSDSIYIYDVRDGWKSVPLASVELKSKKTRHGNTIYMAKANHQGKKLYRFLSHQDYKQLERK